MDLKSWAGFSEFTMMLPFRFIIVSARDTEQQRVKALMAGAVAYLQKPVRSDQLPAAVRAALEKSGNNPQ